jgi:two-component system, OmpR family, sensor kinase
MLESLAARLLVWHTVIVTAVVATFGATVCYLVWRAKIDDVDAALQSRAAALSEALRPADQGGFDLILAPPRAAERQPYHVLWTRDGDLIDRSDDTLEIPPPSTPGTRTRDGRRELTVRTPLGAVVLVGRDLDVVRSELWGLAAVLLGSGAVVLALSSIAGWLSAQRALAPINRISATARRMVDGDLSARIPVERVETELGQVARALNDAFDRLQASLDRQQRLTADVSHELRTPLTSLSTEVQWALGRDRPAAAYRESLEVCRRAAGRMLAIVERLLALARAETMPLQEPAVAVSLDGLVRRVVDDLAPLAAGRELTVTVNTPPVTVSGDPDRLLEAVTNVVANAIAYNVPHGQVTVAIEQRDGLAELSVTDTGIGIRAEDLPLVFDPFFRADHARSRDAGGAGLGLTLTRSIIERHGGTVACFSRTGHGTVVVIRLPTARAA